MGIDFFEQFCNKVEFSPKDSIRFHCDGCGKCCRYHQDTVMIENLDVFRITKHLRDTGEGIESIEEFLSEYANPVTVDDSGFTIFALKTKGDDGSCVFLENNRCLIHSANPRVCRTYPLCATIGDDGKPKYYLIHENLHHFKGRRIQIKTWMKERFTQEEREFIKKGLETAPLIAYLMRQTPNDQKAKAVMLFLYYQYYNFDLDQPFLDQYHRNTNSLIQELRKLVIKGA